MDWIKKKYDRFALILLALALAGISGFLIWQSQTFQASFAAVTKEVTHGSKAPPIDDSALRQAKESLAKPAAWGEHPGSLFVSRGYIVKDDSLVAPEESTIPLHPPLTNKWIIDNHLDILDSDILSEDPDHDGFTNQDEFLAGTDPNDKNSHPAFVTRLRLAQWKKERFRLKFEAYDEGANSYQINPIDLRGKSEFRKMGEQIKGSSFKLSKFEKKMVPNPKTGAQTDVSELTVQNTETDELIVLPKGAVVDSPDSWAVFRYLWDNTDLTVKRNQKFTLRPETSVEYKLIDIRDNEAVIRDLKNSGPEIKIPSLQEGSH